MAYRPDMTNAGLSPSHPVTVMDELGELRETHIAGERPLTVYVDKCELVTLMTLGGHPELLTVGYLRNQGLIKDIEEIVAVQVDWDIDAVAVVTRHGVADWEAKLGRRTVTTGCGQGTVFGDLMDHLTGVKLPAIEVRQSVVYALLRNLSEYNEVYKKAGAVHGCALCRNDEILMFCEDVGRHNAVDAIAGHMWLNAIEGGDKFFYTTGRLTSEMVIKVAQMGIPVLLSRSGVTQMGLELAQMVGVTMLARAKGRHFLVFTGADRVVLDERPADRAHRRPGALAG